MKNRAPDKLIKSWAVLVLLWASAGSNLEAGTHYVSLAGGNIPPYTNWATAATNIQVAIDVSVSNDTVVVADGVYSLNDTINLSNSVTLQSQNGATSTTIDGQGRQCMVISGATLDGFTVRGGSISGYGIGAFGGGIWSTDSVVQNCVIVGNSNSGGYGAGIYCDSSVVTNCDILQNNGIGRWDWVWNDGTFWYLYLPTFGGGIACRNSTIVDCRVQGNRGDWGAGIQILEASTVRDCLVRKNVNTWVPTSAAAIQAPESSLLENSLITDNTCIGISLTGTGIVRNCVVASNSYGGLQILGQGVVVQNCTVAGNISSSVVRGGIDLAGVVGPAPCVLENNIVYGNTGTQVSGGNSNAVIRWNCIQGWTNLTDGNITNDPQLTPSYRLKSTSPCIDAGTSSNAPATDIDGEARWDHPGHSNIVSIVDIGADEFVDTDSDDMADYWETGIFGNVTNKDGTADDDNDDLNDWAEYENSTDPGKSDTDDDQMPDGWEVGNALNPLTDDTQEDPDSDVMNNLDEYTADTDPQDPTSVLSILGVASEVGGMRIDWKGGRQAWQYMECCSNLASTADQWTAIFAVPPPAPITNAIIDLGATNKTLFYRIRVHR
ncbi:MAG: hypothetical protein E4H02_08935 [Lentisphaerales bacterium]|jgi:hypothetical protein|nr:MAG: hypothetical protein E4H02_08935 [Lentisphaerales bacterium]